MQDEPFQKDVANIKAVMREYIDTHPGLAPYYFPIDPSKSMATQAAAIALSCERGQTIILSSEDTPEPGEAKQP
jgi:hypothetical protein